MNEENNKTILRNVVGTTLQSCCSDPLTGYFRDGFCRTTKEDQGTHIVCAVMTDDFLKFTRQRGNDLSTPRPEWSFPGLQAGDKWCLCIRRWLEAEKSGVAPKIDLKATDQKALEFTTIDILKKYSI